MGQTGTGLSSTVGIIAFNLHSNAVTLVLLSPIVPRRKGGIRQLLIDGKNAPDSNLDDLMPELGTD